MIASANSGVVVTGVYEIGRPLVAKWSSIGTVVALVKANIDKYFLEGWVNLQKLQADFPNRVKIVNSTVSLQGPVVVLPNLRHITVLKIALPILLGALTVALIRAIWTNAAADRKGSKTPLLTTTTTGGEDESSNLVKHIVTAACSLAVAAATFVVAQRILPTAPGIYFFGR